MRIAYVTETFLPSIDGVVTRVTKALDWLQAAGHEVLVICPDLGVTSYGSSRVVGVRAVRYPLYRARPWGTPSAAISRAIDGFRPDVVHVWHPAVMGVRAVPHAERAGIPLITSYHTNVVRYLDYYGPARALRRPVLWAMRRLNNSSPVTLVTSRAMRASLTGLGFAGVEVLPRGVDLTARDPSFRDAATRARLTGGHPERPLLLFVGRVAAEKGLDALVPVMRAHPAWSLAIVGDGPDRARLEGLFAGTATTFTGFLRGEELSRAFASADVFVFPSTTETLGLVLLEAMASCLPVVAASSPATDEQMRGGACGVVYDPVAAGALEEALEQVVGSPALAARLRDAGLREASACGWDGASSALLGWYERTIALYRAGWRPPAHPGRPQPARGATHDEGDDDEGDGGATRTSVAPHDREGAAR